MSSAQLRQCDWRFLLPRRGGPFPRLVLSGGSASLASDLKTLGVADEVSASAQPETADALVLLQDGAQDLPEAGKFLKRGGVVYWEVRRTWRFWRSSPRAIRRRLRAAGLVPLGIYWPRPSFRRPAIYIPVESRAALRWYVETYLSAGSFSRWAARAVLRALGAIGGLRSWGVEPRYAVTAIAGAPAAPGGEQGGVSAFESDWDGREDRCVLLRGADGSRRVLIFPFTAGSRAPSSVIKMWRLPYRDTHVQKEQAVMREIRSLLDGAVETSVPEPLGTLRWGNVVAGIEALAPGHPLSSDLNAWRRSTARQTRDLHRVADWLARFHEHAQVTTMSWDPTLVRQWVDEPLARHQSVFGMPDERFCAAIRGEALSLAGSPMPFVWAHPDLTSANIHVNGGDLTVVDWSGAKPRLPLYDLLYFVVLWAAGIRQETTRAARSRLFDTLFLASENGDAATRAVRASIRAYLKRLGIDPRFFPVLLTVAWVVRSLEAEERERAAERGEPDVNPHPGESYFECVSLLASSKRQLFERSCDAWWRR
jgi:hypothetical protein